MHLTLLDFFDHKISLDDAINYLTCVELRDQYVLKTDKAVKNLILLDTIPLTQNEKWYYQEVARQEKKDALDKMYKKQMEQNYSDAIDEFNEIMNDELDDLGDEQYEI